MDHLGSFLDGFDWLAEETPAPMSKTAGKKFSPQEQRDLIDEQGEARNLHRLALEGTHYETDEELASIIGW